jgi:hypothetical protein
MQQEPGICGAPPGDLIDWMEHEREKPDEAVEDMEPDAKERRERRGARRPGGKGQDRLACSAGR